ncbi:MAG TPA: zinc ribbon domain-containing protein [Candidatus Ozemobacteraceae bacterium]
MKKQILSTLALLLMVSPVWAVFCQYCGKTMADDGVFCPQCGKKQPAQAPIVTTSPVTPAPSVPPAPRQESAPVASPGELSVTPYEEIGRYETLLTTAPLDRAAAEISERRTRISEALRKIGPETARFTPGMQKLHGLYLRKYDLLDRYYDAWNRSVNGPGRVEAAAEKEKLLFTIARTGEMIVYLKDHLGESTALTRIDEMERALEEGVREHRVTAPYLRLEGRRMKTQQRFWVMDIDGDRAMIMMLDDCGGSKPFVGWLSLSDLERRTTYRSPRIIVPPPVRVEKEVVIIGPRIWWPGWPHPHRQPRHDDHDRHPGPAPRGDHDRDRDRDHRH